MSKNKLARVPGFEPGLAVLETAVLAVKHYTDTNLITATREADTEYSKS